MGVFSFHKPNIGMNESGISADLKPQYAQRNLKMPHLHLSRKARFALNEAPCLFPKLQTKTPDRMKDSKKERI